MNEGDRGSGRTSYAERLAKHLGRPDLRIKPMSWYLGYDGINVRGMSPHMVVIDHAAEV